ncbi:MAG: heme exporter protein CcmD [Kangiellaceae bacterium]
MMYFESFDAFIEMGGHGFYVWLCYALVLVFLLGYYVISARSSNRAKVELRRFYARLEAQGQFDKEKQ